MNCYTTHYGGYDFEHEAPSREDAQAQALAHFKAMTVFKRINLSLADMKPILLVKGVGPLDPVVDSPIFQ